MNALRDRILELATDGTRAGYVSPTTNSLYERLAAWYRQRGEVAPISRALFYKWFGASPGSPSHQLLEWVPGFAALLGVEEYELFAAAGLLRPGLDAPLTIASAARQVRQASRLISRVLTEAAVPSSAGRSSPTGSCTTNSTTRSPSGPSSVVTAGPCTCIPWSPSNRSNPTTASNGKRPPTSSACRCTNGANTSGTTSYPTGLASLE